jgi:hypothetical protein
LICLLLAAVSFAAQAPTSDKRPEPASSATAPSTRPATAPASRPAAAEAERRARQLRRLTGQAIDQIKRNRLDSAENTLKQALEIAPDHPTNLYNMACVKALKGQSEPALEFLQKAALEGFTDFAHVERDPDLQSLRGLPRYKAIIALRDEFQRKAADRVMAWLKREFGEGYLYEIDEKNRLILATNTDEATLKELKRWLSDQANSQRRQLFSHKPDQYVSVVLPSSKDYKEIVRQPGVGGFYNPANRMLIAQRLGQIMTHEFTHALHGADQDALGQEHPIWLIEGLGSLYEASQFSGDGEARTLEPSENFRLSFVQAAARNNRTIPLDRLLKMDQPQFMRNPTLSYGQSGSLLMYLYDKGQLRKFYDAFKADFEKEKTGKGALEQALGKPVAEIEKDWKVWVQTRTPPPMSTGENGAVLGVRFGEANDGLRVEFVVPTGPAARDGLKVSDIVVGIDEIDIRDQMSLVPILAQRKPGDVVTLKVRRDNQYFDLPVTLARRGEEVNRPQPDRPASRQ